MARSNKTNPPALQKSLLNLLLNQAPAILWSVDKDLRMTCSLGAGLKKVGLVPNQHVGMTLMEFHRTDDPDAFPLNHHHRALKGKSTVYEYPWGDRTLHSRLEPLRNARGDIIGTLGLGLDITERKRAEEALRQSLVRMRRLAARLDQAREEERRSIALDIHDRLGQALTSCKIDLSSLVSVCRHANRDERKRLTRTLKTLDKAIRTVRQISTGLRPAVLDRLGLRAALEWQAREFQSLTGIPVRLFLPSRDIFMNPDASTAVFRIFQELLTNIARHADAKRVDVRLFSTPSRLIITVKDDGRGISKEALSNPAALGLLGMKERALTFEGTINIKGEKGKGTTARLMVPFPSAVRKPR